MPVPYVCFTATLQDVLNDLSRAESTDMLFFKNKTL